jgi:hypothetical protein
MLTKVHHNNVPQCLRCRVRQHPPHNAVIVENASTNLNIPLGAKRESTVVWKHIAPRLEIPYTYLDLAARGLLARRTSCAGRTTVFKPTDTAIGLAQAGDLITYLFRPDRELSHMESSTGHITKTQASWKVDACLRRERIIRLPGVDEGPAWRHGDTGGSEDGMVQR